MNIEFSKERWLAYHVLLNVLADYHVTPQMMMPIRPGHADGFIFAKKVFKPRNPRIHAGRFSDMQLVIRFLDQDHEVAAEIFFDAYQADRVKRAGVLIKDLYRVIKPGLSMASLEETLADSVGGDSYSITIDVPDVSPAFEKIRNMPVVPLKPVPDPGRFRPPTRKHTVKRAASIVDARDKVRGR